MGFQSLLATEIPKQEVAFDFYSEPIVIKYDTRMVLPIGNDISEEVFKRFYFDLKNTTYLMVVGGLLSYRKKMELNDWLYYMLIYEFVEEAFQGESKNFRTLFSWFLLHKSGYQVQLNYVNNSIMLSVFSHDIIYDMPVRAHEDGWFVELTAYEHTLIPHKVTSYRSDFNINSQGKPFSFRLTQLPQLSNPNIATKSFSFIHYGKLYPFSIDINESLVGMMFRYPELSIKEHAETPVSIQVRESLYEELDRLTADMDDFQAIRFFLSFTRMSKSYETDKAAYNVQNLAFTPEETLYYLYSDCEDRSALFSNMVKEVLGMDVLLVDFPGHASAAVHFEKAPRIGTKEATPIFHKGKPYYICDPTGPGNHLRLGEYPAGFETTTPRILTQ
ncbi:MAG: hypothetical protein AB8B69_08245 [Chitinophagales bacterium]